ncbi:MAG TPA: acetyl-CoA acetyltransferase [Herpetosiphonaceae bacterium]|nr:acetyl-CoA acetyltransferase [Herpetosiphonaceae bacterium]
MRNVFIAGAGCTPVREHYDRSLLDLALAALGSALGDIAPERVGALYVASALGDSLAEQGQLGAYVAGAAGITAEAVRVEAAGASGGAALRQGYLAVASGQADLVAVLGVEKVTDKLDSGLQSALALGLDGALEAAHGLTLAGGWALLMRRYLHEHGLPAAAFAPFAVNAHANGAHNPDALYRFAINAAKWSQAAAVADPLNMLDCSTLADGAAAVVLVSEELARAWEQPPVRIAGSASAAAPLALAHRPDPLSLEAAARSGAAALAQAGLDRAAVDVLELSDPHGIAAALALEALGYAERGAGTSLGASGAIARDGAIPLASGGGMKARGDVGGATGVYQIVEVVRQLRGAAGPGQIPGARTGLAQCLGGVGATAVTHVLRAE